MKQKLLLLGMLWVTAPIIAIAESQVEYSCPAIKICKASASTKHNFAILQENDIAYSCYRSNGDLALAKKSSLESSRCQTIIATATATIKGN
jgi:hypothetical protein